MTSIITKTIWMSSVPALIYLMKGVTMINKFTPKQTLQSQVQAVWSNKKR